MMHIGLELWCI